MEAALCQMVCRRPAQRQLQLPGPPSRHPHGQQGRLDLGGRTRRPRPGRAKNAPSPTNNSIAKSASSPTSSNATASSKGDRVIIYLPMVPEAAVAMLACARIGAVHSVVFGGFSAQSVADRIFDCQAKLVITADGGFRRGSIVPLEKKRGRGAHCSRTPPAGSSPPRSRNVIVLRRARNDIHIQEGRDLWWHRELEYVQADCPGGEAGQRSAAFYTLHQRLDRQAQGHPAHHRRLFAQRQADHPARLRSARRGCLLVYRRCRLGHRPQLRRLWPAGQRRHQLHVRGRAQFSRAGPLLAHRGQVRRDHPLHRPHRHPRLHEMGRAMAGQTRSPFPAPAGHRGRADQPGGLDVVSRSHRPETLSYC